MPRAQVVRAVLRPGGGGARGRRRQDGAGLALGRVLRRLWIGTFLQVEVDPQVLLHQPQAAQVLLAPEDLRRGGVSGREKSQRMHE